MAVTFDGKKILLVDDDQDMLTALQAVLADTGADISTAADGNAAILVAAECDPDLVVLDIELGDPDMDGLDVCKRIRTLGLNMPVIFLTVRSTVEDLEHGLSVAGPGSDYVRKLEELRRMQEAGQNVGDVQVAAKAPDTHELIARIRARLPLDVQNLGAYLRIDRKRMSVERRVEGVWEVVRLQPLEYEVFKTLVDANDRVVGSWDLYDNVFRGGLRDSEGSNDSGIDNYKNRVWVCIANLRKKIDPDGKHDYILTVHGIGYRFRAEGSY